MIAEHEIFLFGNHARRHRTLIAKLGRDVALHERLAVDDHLALVHFYTVARHSDHALDVGLARVARKPKDHRIAAVNVTEMEAVNKLVDEDPLLIVERGHHAGALHLHRLVDEQDYEDDQHH